jgi:hypothetical protein
VHELETERLLLSGDCAVSLGGSEKAPVSGDALCELALRAGIGTAAALSTAEKECVAEFLAARRKTANTVDQE